MNRDELDRLIRQSLTPADEVRTPAGLAEAIGRRLHDTPQRGRSPLGRWVAPRRGGAMSTILWLLLLVTLVVAAALAALRFRADTDLSSWITTYHGDPARTGVAQGPAPMGPVSVAWEAGVAGQLLWTHMPLVVDDMVIAADSRGGVTAFGLQAGEELWQVAATGDIGGTPLASRDLVIVGADDGGVTAMRRRDGAVVWTHQLGAPVRSSLGGAGDLVLVGADDGLLHALDIGSGLQRWSVEVGGALTKAPAVADGIGYVGSTTGRLVAFDAATGTVVWRRDLGPGDIPTPAFADGVLYVTHAVEGSGRPSDLLAIDARSSGDLWAWPAPTAGFLGVGAVADGVVYANGEDGAVHAIDARTGSGHQLMVTGGQLLSPDAWVAGVLFLSSQDGVVTAADADSGQVIWSITTLGAPGPPALAAGHVIVGTDLGKLVAIRAVEPAGP